MGLLSRTLSSLDWPFVVAELASNARTSAGRRAIEELPLLGDAPAITTCFDAIDEVHGLVANRAGAPPVGGVEDIAEALERAARGDVLDLEDLGAARATLRTLSELARFLAKNAATAPTLVVLGSGIALERRLCATFEAALDEHGALSEVTYPVLGQLRRRIASLERRMHSVLEELIESADYADLLQERYVTIRDGRFVLPIKSQAKGMGLGIVHDSSRTGQTVFVEPAQVVPIGNERRVAESDLKAEDRRIRTELSQLLADHATSLREALEAATDLDVACARADFASRLGAVRPRVGGDGVVDLRHARHPVLALGGESVVANDLTLTAAHPILVLTGPNAGGKTVAMKTIGLCALLVRAGCFVPAAAGSRIDLFPSVFADIGDMQTVHEGLSSFSAHLTTLREMLASAGAGTLLLLDEIAAGTDPAQGGPLARAVIERFADVGARIVVTTHYAQVKAMAADDPRVEVSALEYRDGKPTYRVVPGTAGESHALSAALRVGLEASVVERARTLMDEGDRALHEALTALEDERTRAAEAEKKASAAAAALEARERTLAAREEAIRVRARAMEEKESKAFVDRLRAADAEVRRVMDELRESRSQESAGKARQAIREARAASEPPREAAAGPSRAPQVGDRVRLLRLGTLGDVVSFREDEVEVRAGSMIVRAKASELEVVGKAAAGAAKSWASKARSDATRGRTEASRGDKAVVSRDPSRASLRPDDKDAATGSDDIELAVRTPGNTLDLRGARVEEGLALLETFLDESMLASRDVVFVLHGHGTGAMKSAVRRVLAASRYVRSCSPAAEEQGGDALTLVHLR